MEIMGLIPTWNSEIFSVVPLSVAKQPSFTSFIHGSQGGYTGFQVMGMIEWSQKSRPKKIPQASSKTQKNPWTKRTTQPGHYQFFLNITPKKSLLKSSYPKKYLPNFRIQKNPAIKNFKPKKNPSIIPVT